jgi:hypothetical protein
VGPLPFRSLVRSRTANPGPSAAATRSGTRISPAARGTPSGLPCSMRPLISSVLVLMLGLLRRPLGGAEAGRCPC